MSAIGGVLQFGGRAVEPRDLERVANALRSHGPDKSGIWLDGHVGLIHVLMRITPEDRFDRQPWQGASGATLVADLRIDNRDAVASWLGLSPLDIRDWADSRLLLSAWERLGDQVWARLRGTFAAAIWNPNDQTLTLARDHLGQNVVMWHKTANAFAFASMPKGLFALPNVGRELHEEKLADFLVLNHNDHTSTFYRNIFRVLPSHIMRVRADGVASSWRFWSPTEIQPIFLTSDQAYAEGLLERLQNAVRRQMRSAHPIACHLSGGLDSSSIAVLAARELGKRNERLSAFTHVPRRGFAGAVPIGRYANETKPVLAIAEIAGNIDLTFVPNDECDDFAELEKFFGFFEAPVRNPTNLGWILAILRLARKAGRRVLLGGLYGNATISWSGWDQAPEHLMRGRLMLAYRQWQLFYRLSPHSRWTAFRKLLLEPLVPRWLVASSGTNRRSENAPPWRDYAPIRTEFAYEMGVDTRAASAGHDFRYRRQLGERTRMLASVDYAGEWRAAEKAATGVETRDPTSDIDVVEYCFGIPPEQYLAEGIDRSLIRRAMWGLLPEATLTNRLRGLQSPDWYEKLERRRHELKADISELATSALVRRVIDIDRLDQAIANWPSSGWHDRETIKEYHLALTRGIATARFLRWLDPDNYADPS